MSALDKKLLRDLMGMWTQAIAIALVVAAGVATLILAVGAYRSLEETRAAYYERHRFAHVFAAATRAPRGLMDRILELPGVAAAEARITKNALLDIAGFAEPATGLVISLPTKGEPILNRLYIRSGRLPQAGETTSAAVNEDFAEAHGFHVGSRFKALLGGRKRELTIVGIVLSPEFIYAVGPGDFVPDDRRFGILWMEKKAVEASYDLENAFNSVSL
ncbi:MAG: ABC transporter permease, partial [Hyphomicrobiales bacterium]